MNVTVSAWTEGDRYIGLRALLDAIGTNDWTWRLDEFHGSTRPDSDVGAVDLENRLRAGDMLLFTWDELLAFADKVVQLIDGRLSALVAGQPVPVLTIEARDSTDWVVVANAGCALAASAIDRVAALRG